MSPFLYLLLMKDLITRILKEQVDLKNLGLDVEPSDRVIKSICDAKNSVKLKDQLHLVN